MAKSNAERCRDYYYRNREARIEASRQNRLKTPEAHSLYDKELNRRRRVAVLEHYGDSCACCGETIEAFLTVDHIDGSGAEHRRQGATSIYRWLVTHNFPEGYQILCWNCNAAKHIQNGCPHQQLVGVIHG